MQVIDAADVILEVLDARDPLGSRCTQMEEAVLASGATKKLVLLLNKIGSGEKRLLFTVGCVVNNATNPQNAEIILLESTLHTKHSGMTSELCSSL